MPQPIARFLVLRDSRRLPLAVALALALGSFVASGDLIALGGDTIGGPRHGGSSPLRR